MNLLMTCLLAMCIMTGGCACLSDRGDVSETSVYLPDGTTVIFVRIQRVRLFTPSTEEKITFLQGGDGSIERTNDLGQNYQDGIGSSLLKGAIKSGAIAATAMVID